MSPRTKDLSERMRAETLARIDAAALRVFAEYGYHGATIRRIAKTAGLSYGLVYHYFPSKARVFVRLVDFALEESLQAMRRFMGVAGTAWERIEAYAAMIVASIFAVQTSYYFVIMLQAMTQGRAVPGLPARIAKKIESYYRLLVPVIAEAQESGQATPGDPMALAAGFFSMVQGLAMLVFQRRNLEKKITPAVLTNVLRNAGSVRGGRTRGRPGATGGRT